MASEVEQYLQMLLQGSGEEVLQGIAYDLLEQIGLIQLTASLLLSDMEDSKQEPDEILLLKDVIARTERLEVIVEAMRRYEMRLSAKEK